MKKTTTDQIEIVDPPILVDPTKPVKCDGCGVLFPATTRSATYWRPILKPGETSLDKPARNFCSSDCADECYGIFCFDEEDRHHRVNERDIQIAAKAVAAVLAARFAVEPDADWAYGEQLIRDSFRSSLEAKHFRQ